MEEEIDLREYVDVIIRRWKWIVGLTLLAAVTSAVGSFMMPPLYEATVTLVATEPKYVLQFEPRFVSLADIAPPSKVYSALVKTPQLEQRVIEALPDPLKPSQGLAPEDLERMAIVAQGDDPSVILLKVRHTDREFAALVANTWAQFYVEQMGELYGHSAAEESYFQKQLEFSTANLKEAEQALIEFEGRSRIAVFTERIAAKSQALANYLSAQEGTESIIQDAEGLRQQLRSEGGTPAIASNLSILLLQVTSLSSRTGLPLEIQLSVDQSGFPGTDVQEQIAFLENLISTLEVKREEIVTAVETLSPEILHLQEELQQEETEKDRLVRARDVAEETYISLSRKVDEVRIVIASEDSGVRIASLAITPERPVAPRKLLNMTIAGVLGLMGTTVAAFVAEYWRRPKE